MAIGRESVAPREVRLVVGKAGRLSAPPQGGLYVRDVQVARARAVAERVEALEAAGLEVPEELAALAAECAVSDEDEVVDLVDALTGELLAEGDATVDEDAPIEEEVVEELEGPEPVEREVDVESLTVAELRSELDALGVEHSHEDRKPDLQAKLRDALAE
jgi:hypothetical protein